MGHTVSEWWTKVQLLVRDETGKDLKSHQAEQAVRSALAQYSADRPREVIIESAGTGSPYIALPLVADGWVAGASTVKEIEHPARQNPPRILDRQSWLLVRDPVTVATETILLNRTPTVSEFVRITFTAPWPFPTATAADDPLDDLAYEAVAALSASFALIQLVGETARSRRAAIPSDFSDGRDASRSLLDAAERYRSLYNGFLGMTPEGDEGGGSNAPAWGTYDLDPQRHAIFHGGRR